MNTQTNKVFNVLSRNEEISHIRVGTLLKASNIQKREYYRILKIIRSFDNKPLQQR